MTAIDVRNQGESLNIPPIYCQDPERWMEGKTLVVIHDTLYTDTVCFACGHAAPCASFSEGMELMRLAELVEPPTIEDPDAPVLGEYRPVRSVDVPTVELPILLDDDIVRWWVRERKYHSEECHYSQGCQGFERSAMRKLIYRDRLKPCRKCNPDAP